MNTFFKSILFLFAAACFIVACDKVGDLPYYTNGTAPTATASSSAVAPAPADSNNVALTVSWTNPGYAVDSATAKYVIEIDSAGRNFSKAVSKTVNGALTTAFTAKDLNTIALNYGFVFNTAYGMEMRVVSSYANNNDQKISNVIAFRYTPYKIPPKVELPPSGKLFITGDATQGSWTNMPPTPSQEFYRVDETTWAGVFKLNAGGGYIILRNYGSWDEKYAVQDGGAVGINTGGDFGYHAGDAFNANIPGPATAGLYVITLNFQTGKFTVVPYIGGTLPDNLYIVGNATDGGWNNPVPTPSQQFTRLNSSVFELSVSLKSGAEFLLLPVNGDWSHKFALNEKNTDAQGTFQYDTGSNFPGPTSDGTYKVDVDFINNTYTLTKQ